MARSYSHPMDPMGPCLFHSSRPLQPSFPFHLGGAHCTPLGSLSIPFQRAPPIPVGSWPMCSPEWSGQGAQLGGIRPQGQHPQGFLFFIGHWLIPIPVGVSHPFRPLAYSILQRTPGFLPSPFWQVQPNPFGPPTPEVVSP